MWPIRPYAGLVSQWFSTPGSMFPGGLLAVPGDIFSCYPGVHHWHVVIMLLNVLQDIGQNPATKNCLSPNVNGAAVENLGLSPCIALILTLDYSSSHLLCFRRAGFLLVLQICYLIISSPLYILLYLKTPTHHPNVPGKISFSWKSCVMFTQPLID